MAFALSTLALCSAAAFISSKSSKASFYSIISSINSLAASSHSSSSSEDSGSSLIKSSSFSNSSLVYLHSAQIPTGPAGSLGYSSLPSPSFSSPSDSPG